MNHISAKNRISAGTLTKVQTTTDNLVKTSDVLQHDSSHVVRTANQIASDVMKHDLENIAADASSLADMLRNPHEYH
ncbi:MAG: hypothetical protein HOC57_13790 [Rhodospirillaceae bacterium]|nr:hypothetical protein [Rhodospirillaceae bacterium]MBT4590360.1 hypothetical protein [Rhodospirillaceae bacterium]